MANYQFRNTSYSDYDSAVDAARLNPKPTTGLEDVNAASTNTSEPVYQGVDQNQTFDGQDQFWIEDDGRQIWQVAADGGILSVQSMPAWDCSDPDDFGYIGANPSGLGENTEGDLITITYGTNVKGGNMPSLIEVRLNDATGQVVQDATTSTGFVYGENTYRVKFSLPSGWSGGDVDGNKACVQTNVTVVQNDPLYDCDVAGPTINSGTHGDPVVVQWAVAPADNDWVVTPNTLIPGSAYTITGIEVPAGYSNNGGAAIQCQIDANEVTVAQTTLAQFDCSDAQIVIADGPPGANVEANTTVAAGVTISSISPAVFDAATGSRDYDVVINIPSSGYNNSGGLLSCPTPGVTVAVAKTISLNNTNDLAFDSTGNPIQTKIVTIEGNATGFSTGTHIQYTAGSNSWLNVSLDNFTTSGGNLQFSANAYTGAQPRSVEVQLEHPEDDSIQTTAFTITQSAGNQPPIGSNLSRQITWQSSVAALDLDFKSPVAANWTGTAINDLEDGDNPDVIITDISGLTVGNFSATLKDSSDSSSTTITSNDLPYTLVGPARTIKLTPYSELGETQAGNINFKYKVKDSGDLESPEYTVTLLVSPPANEAPNAIDKSISIVGAGNGDTTDPFAFGSAGLASDDNDAPAALIYKWVDNANGANAVLFTAGDRTGLHGTFTEANGVLQYTYTGNTLTPNDDDVVDEFWFTATDSEGESSGGARIFVTMTAALNTPPVITINNNANTDTISFNALQYEAVTPNVPISATDGEGHTLTWSAEWDASSNNSVNEEKGNFSINENNGVWFYESGDWDMQPNTPYDTYYIIKVRDEFGGEDSYTLQLTITGVSFIGGTTISANGKLTSASACDENRPTDVFLDADVAQSVSLLEAGHFLYTENTLQDSDKFIPGSDGPWHSIQQDVAGNVVIRVVKLAADGTIEQIFDCAQTLDYAWPIDINYSTNSNDLCQPGPLDYTVTQATVYQNVINPDDAAVSLQAVINAGGQLFTSQYYANQPEYRNDPTNIANTYAPASLCVAPGFYNDDNRDADPNQIIYYEFTTNAEGQGVWNPSSVNDTQTVYEWNCPIEIEYGTYKFNAFYSELNRESVDAICSLEDDDLTKVDLYVRLDLATMEGSTPFFNTHYGALEYVMKNQVLVYKTEADANSVNYNGLWETTVFVAIKSGVDLTETDPNSYIPGVERKFAIWDNENDSGYVDGIPANNFTYSWVGADATTLNLEYSTTNTILGNCVANFEQPDGHENFCLGLPNNDCTTSDLDTSRTNVFYAFYSCVSKIEGGDPYWNLYIVDGLHTFATNSTSYIKKLIDVIEPGVNAGVRLKLSGDTMLECVALQHKIFAVNYNDASTIALNLPEYGSDVRVVEINPVELGFASNAVIEYRENCIDCILDTGDANTFTLDSINDADVINRSLPNFNLEKNYELDNLSKPLLRTNPKLSTNAKLVVNSTDAMYIESIDATKELASVEYKKWPVNKLGKWSYDLAKFFNNNKTPSDIVYFSKSRFSDFTVQESFEKQIEEDYHYGTTYNYSKLHNEDFRMLAPIWLDKNIPSNFVIFRVSDPAAVLDFDTQSNFNNINEILKNSELIKTFDLTRDSNIGTYLRNHVQSELFPSNPISVNFSENERTNFNGIDLVRGGFTNKGEYLFDDFVKQDQTIISENELITAGFERNKLACANLINLEFLFDDDGADDYAVNRYFGLYVNDVDSGYGTLESANNGLLKFKTLNSYINEDSESAIPPVKLMSSTPTLGYAHVSNNFYKISTDSYYDTSNLELRVEDSTNLISNEIKLAEVGTSIDIIKNTLAESDFVKLTINETPANNDRISIFPSKEQDYRIKVVRYNPGDLYNLSLTLNTLDQSSNTWNNVTYTFGLELKDTMEQTISHFIDSNPGIFDANLTFKADGNDFLIYEKKVTLNSINPIIEPAGSNNISIARVQYTQVPFDLENNMYFGSDALPAGHFNTTAFSTQGTNAEIAQALTKSINSKDNGFTALTYDGADHLYIKNDVVGYRLMQSGIAVPNGNANDWVHVDSANEIEYTENNKLRLQLTGSTSNTFRFSKIYFFNGGNSAGKSVLASLDSVADINVNDYLETSSIGVYNKVIDIVDDIERLPLEYKKLILEKTNTLEDGEVNVFADNLVRLGLFSAFDIHDMNFDFYDTANSELKELQWEVANNINYEPEIDNQSDIYPFGDRGSSDYLKAPVSYFTGLSDVLEEERTDEANEKQVLSEYDRLQENYLKEYAIQSRVVPTINKWVLKDTLTVREQPYYLNANEAFGRSNFSADLSVRGRNRVGMTHEWFYINNLPKYLKENQGDYTNPEYRLNESFSYLNFMDGIEMSPAMFKDINYDYFDRFFVTEGFETSGDNKYKTFVKTNRQKKYTLVNGGNDTAFADTIFKGLKVIFKNRKEFNASSPVDFVKSSEFNGYRFSTVLNVKTSQDSNGIEYEVIQNKKFKYVVFFISLSIDDLWADQTLTRKLLYELNHSLVWNNEEGTFKYSDVKIDGHLDLTGANFTHPDGDDYLVINGLEHADGNPPQFLEQINKNTDDEFGSLIVEYTTLFGTKVIELDISNVESQTQITLASQPKDLSNGGIATDLSDLPSYVQYNARYTYKGGGVNAYKYILESLGAQDMADMLLRNPDNIKYSTVELDGSIGLSKFIILLEDGVEFIKKAELDTNVDDDKPESFKLSSGNIGYNLGLTRVYYPFLIRHNGGYTIDTTPVVTFTDVYTHMKTNTLQNTSDIIELELEEQMYKHSLTSTKEIQLAKDYYRRYNRCGVAFNLGFIYDGGAHDAQWGIIKNHFYRKVNEFKSSGVIKLSVSSDKPPLYPLIGEIAIDKKDVNVFKSSWDKNYYTRSLSGGINEEVPGTFETKEERSYLASTIMKIKDSYTMLNFEVDRVKTEGELDDILANSTNKTDIVLFEDKKRVVMDFYIDFTINKKLSGDGVLDTIKKYVLAVNSAADKTTLTDDAQLYIRKNLINAFNIDQIKLYTKRFKGSDSTLEIVDTISNLDDNNYNSDQNFEFSSHEQKPLNFRLIYNKRLGYSYRIRPMVKITS